MIDPREIVEYLRQEAGRPLKPKELAKAFGIANSDYAEFKQQLQKLEAEGALYRVQRQRYAAPERINLLAGRIQTTRAGAGYLIPDDGSKDVFIPADGLNTALNGDRVVCRLERRRGRDRPEGSVVRVLERARSTVVGTFRPLRPGGDGRVAHGFVVPEDRKLPRDIFITPGATGAAADGDLVVVRITDWGSEHRGPSGEVEEVLGRLGDPGVDVLAIIRNHELPTDFPAEVERLAEQLSERGITAKDLEQRTDLRDRLIFTIDPLDAKDHDDALSIEPLPDGWRVGIHIADVSHYVREGNALDREAAQRGTSVYLVDRVVPMLPHALSSDICSLVPDQDRLTISLFVDLDAAGATRGHHLARAVIRSRHKLAYEQAQAVLDGKASIDDETDQALRMLRDVARLLRRARSARGSLDFDLPEARVVLNSSGEPTDIQRVLRLESHRLIEDFMLLANEVVARKAIKAELPFVYRIHEAPDSARMEQLRDFVATFGHRLAGKLGSPTPKDLQRLLEGAAGKPEEGLVATVVLRSMKQARYSEQNVGHFGLAMRSYTHFTSPIRRYPDLVVHRILTGVFIDRRQPWLPDERLADTARSSSERERIAVAAERDSKDLKKVEFMQRHLDAEFAGTISSVTSFGFFVLLDDYFVDGLVHVSSLADDYYLFVEEQYALLGEHTRRRFRTGDRVRVRVESVDLDERRIDFRLVDKPGPARAKSRKPGKKTQRKGRPPNRRR